MRTENKGNTVYNLRFFHFTGFSAITITTGRASILIGVFNAVLIEAH
jgi:hypothetical protein